MKKSILLLAAILGLTACDPHSKLYPGDGRYLELNLTIDNADFEHFITLNCDPEGTASESCTRATAAESELKLRYTVDLYKNDGEELSFLSRMVKFATPAEPNITVTFHEVALANYKVLAWCEYVMEDGADWLYDTADLRAIKCTKATPEDNNYKRTFSSALDANLTTTKEKKNTYDLTLGATQGSFRCVSQSVPDSIIESGNIVTSVVTYTLYISAGYNVAEQMPNDFAPTRTFIAKTEVDKEGDVELFHDYVFLNDTQTNIKVNLEFYEGEVTISEDGEVLGKKINEWSSIVVPLERGHNTIIEGHMLEQFTM